MSYIGEYKFDPNIIIHKKMHVDKSYRHSMSKGVTSSLLHVGDTNSFSPNSHT